MDNDIAIKVENVSKKFCKSLKRSMFYGISDIGKNALGLSSHSESLRNGEFWAVDDVSFEVRKGETLGIIGPNGSGKSTLLKMLNGIFWPDKGRITVKGKVGALIEIGAGFHPMLTGRENIYVNAAILGMTKKEVDEKFDDIVKFADIGDFLDSPVKFYSSGMYVRLGFAIAVHCEPEILLVDEILSVGDRNFQKKSIERMKEIISNDKSVIFVSHNLLAVRALCQRAIWLDNNKMRAEGSADGVVSKYEQFMDSVIANADANKLAALDQRQSGLIKFTDVQILDENGIRTKNIEFKKYACIRAWYNATERISDPNFRFLIRNPEGQPNNIIAPSGVYQNSLVSHIEPGEGYVDCIIEKIPLMPGNYFVRLVLTSIDYLVFYTRTLYDVPFSISYPTGQDKDTKPFLIHDSQVWIPAKIEYGRQERDKTVW